MDESKKPTGEPTGTAATSWPLDGPASPCPAPESVSERLTLATAGLRSLTPLLTYDRASHSWNAAQAFLPIVREDIGLDASRIWPRSGCMLGGSVYEQARPALPTGATGSGALPGEPWPTPTPRQAGGTTLTDSIQEWPTPTAGDAKASGAQGYSTESGRHPGTALTDAAAREWPTPTAQTYGTNQGGSAGRVGPVRPSLEAAARDWPTPTASDNGSPTRFSDGEKLSGAACWPTPKAQDGDGRGAQAKHGKGRRSNLIDAEAAERSWPTPTSADAIRGPFATEEMRTKDGRGAQLPDAVNWPTPTGSDSTGGQRPPEKVPANRQGAQGLKEITKGLLNPRWVEALMGWPLGLVGLPSTVAGPLLAALRKRRGSRRAPAVDSREEPTS
jgi:hypothetical protein